MPSVADNSIAGGGIGGGMANDPASMIKALLSAIQNGGVSGGGHSPNPTSPKQQEFIGGQAANDQNHRFDPVYSPVQGAARILSAMNSTGQMNNLGSQFFSSNAPGTNEAPNAPPVGPYTGGGQLPPVANSPGTPMAPPAWQQYGIDTSAFHNENHQDNNGGMNEPMHLGGPIAGTELIGTDQGTDMTDGNPSGHTGPFDRSIYQKELQNDPHTKQLYKAMMIAEMGSQSSDEDLERFAETVPNRAWVQQRSLKQALGPDYYQPYRDGGLKRAYAELGNNPDLNKRLDGVIDKVMGGSDLSHEATQNASGGLGEREGARMRGVSRAASNGETFGHKIGAPGDPDERPRLASMPRWQTEVNKLPESAGVAPGEEPEDTGVPGSEIETGSNPSPKGVQVADSGNKIRVEDLESGLYRTKDGEYIRRGYAPPAFKPMSQIQKYQIGLLPEQQREAAVKEWEQRQIRHEDVGNGVVWSNEVTGQKVFIPKLYDKEIEGVPSYAQSGKPGTIPNNYVRIPKVMQPDANGYNNPQHPTQDEGEQPEPMHLGAKDIKARLADAEKKLQSNSEDGISRHILTPKEVEDWNDEDATNVTPGKPLISAPGFDTMAHGDNGQGLVEYGAQKESYKSNLATNTAAATASLRKPVDEAIQAGDHAQRLKQIIGTLEELEDQPETANIWTGPYAERWLEINKMLQPFGANLESNQKITTSDAFNKIANFLATETTHQLTSRPALLEYKTHLGTAPGIQMSQASRKAMESYLKSSADYDLAMARRAQDVLSDPTGAKLSKWRQYAAEVAEKNPISADLRGTYTWAHPRMVGDDVSPENFKKIYNRGLGEGDFAVYKGKRYRKPKKGEQ